MSALAPCGAGWYGLRPGLPDCGCGWGELCDLPGEPAPEQEVGLHGAEAEAEEQEAEPVDVRLREDHGR